MGEGCCDMGTGRDGWAGLPCVWLSVGMRSFRFASKHVDKQKD